MAQDLAAVEDLLHVLSHLPESLQAIRAHHRLVLPQKQQDLMPQRPELLTDAPQVVAQLIRPPEDARPRIAQGCLLEVVETVGHLLQHREDPVQQVVHHVMEEIVEVFGSRWRCALQQPLRQRGEGLAAWRLLDRDQAPIRQQHGHLIAHQLQRVLAEAQAMQHHRHHIGMGIHPCGLGGVQHQRGKHRRDGADLQQLADAMGLPDAIHADPHGQA